MASEPDFAAPKTDSTLTPGQVAPKKPDGPVLRSPKLHKAAWEIPQPKISASVFWFLLILAALVMVILALLIGRLAFPPIDQGPPALASKPFKDLRNGISIQPPLNWIVQDRHDGWNFYIKAPSGEKGFSPLMIVSVEIAPGTLKSYLDEHKARMRNEDKTLTIVSEQPDIVENMQAVRLEYDCELLNDGGKTVKVRTLQFIIDESPRFYRVTCHVAADRYQHYLARFEASARTFRRLEPQAASSVPLKPVP